MARQIDGFYYLRTGAPKGEPRQYPSLEGVVAAMNDLVTLQQKRGFVTTTEVDHKRASQHPDGRMVRFWAENEHGDIID